MGEVEERVEEGLEEIQVETGAVREWGRWVVMEGGTGWLEGKTGGKSGGIIGQRAREVDGRINNDDGKTLLGRKQPREKQAGGGVMLGQTAPTCLP